MAFLFTTHKLFLLTISILPLLAQQANGQQAPAELTVADCARVIRPDSVHLFFDKQYALVPPDCAAIRRETRMDAQGNFVGEVRDYLVADNSLLTKIHYANSQRSGSYEHYYRNHQLACNGQFTNGLPTGTWQYWYSNGQPWQLLELSATAPLRIMAYRDSTGRQRITNGTGTWEDELSRPIPTYSSGHVADGLMDGTWERRGKADKQLLTSEDYRQGQLQAGRQYVGTVGKPKKYTTARLLGPQVLDVSEAIEPYHFGMNCEMQASMRKSQTQDAAIQAATKFPQPPLEPTVYQREILRRLNAFNNSTQWMPRTDGQSITVTANISSTGELSNFASETAVMASALASFVQGLGAWRPATVGGTPVPGKLRFTLRMHSTQLQSSMSAYPAYPLPAEAIQQFRK